ncbi:head maturation protease, ClpP-related [Alkalibaculum sporogenes]|nr:head maturation protease, ClpP-related [Alkalibaculum sporogenes]
MTLNNKPNESEKPAKFFQFKQIDDDTTEVSIFGDITSWRWIESDVSAFSFKKELDAVETPNIDVHIDSYGGEVAEGLAIYNMLKNSGKNVTTIVDGFACSIASVIFMAGSKRIMNTGSLLMWHNPWTYTAGNANELEKEIAGLRKMEESSIKIYKEGSNLEESTIKDIMDAETWITEDEALEWGIATSKIESAAKQSLESKTFHSTIAKLKSLEKENRELKELENKNTSSWDEYWR